MKFTVEKSSLFKSLSHVQSIVEKKNTLPILSNILIEAQNNSLVLSLLCFALLPAILKASSIFSAADIKGSNPND